MKRPSRIALRAGALAAAVAVLAACSSSASGSSGGGGSGSTGSGHGTDSTVTLAYSNAVMQVEKVPLHLTLQNLHKNGTETKEAFNKNGNAAVQEVARGEADFGTANAATVLSAIKKGVPIKAVMASYRPFYVFVVPSSVKDAAGLNGKRVGIQSKVSSTTLYTDLALATAPSAKPKILIVPGSANRVQAMIAGQLDASMLQPADWLKLKQKDPGKYHVIYDVAQKNPNIIDSLIFTSTKTIKQKPKYIHRFVAAMQEEYSNVYKKPDQLATDIANIVPKTPQKTANKLVNMLEKDKVWQADGGFNSGTIQATLDALKKAGLFNANELPTASSCCTKKFIDSSIGG
jgi:ABC-type nitrate/sulfonate/bicarbonate transport system substrate-binding protein